MSDTIDGARPDPEVPETGAGSLEEGRLAALLDYEILDTVPEAEYDLLVQLALELTGSGCAFINFVDRDRVWSKAAAGAGTAGMQGSREGSLCAAAILQVDGLQIQDLRTDRRGQRFRASTGNRWQMYTAVNITTPAGQPVGTLCVLHKRKRALTHRQSYLLAQLARQVTALLELRRTARALRAARDQLQRLALTDTLTGLFNRRAWNEATEQEDRRALRGGPGFSVLMLDLDHFKDINDRYGHEAGDRALVAVGDFLKRRIRATDIAARLGGEEFAVLLSQTTAKSGGAVALELLRGLAELTVVSGGAHLQLTASVGVAHSVEADGADAVLALADRRCYIAKKSGRNRVVMSDAVPAVDCSEE
jgi:diguanylate cyclase (GGDEF)-like protein